MLHSEKISWLKNKLSIELVKEFWIFGSAVKDVEFYNDVDIYIKYSDGCADQIVNLRRELEKSFSHAFGETLHFLALTEKESEEASVFLGETLKTGVKIF